MSDSRLQEIEERIRRGEAEVAALPGYFEILKFGVFDVQVCSDLDDPVEIARRLELVYPAGTSGGWQVVSDTKPDNPVQCASDPGRRHWLFEG